MKKEIIGKRKDTKHNITSKMPGKIVINRELTLSNNIANIAKLIDIHTFLYYTLKLFTNNMNSTRFLN